MIYYIVLENVLGPLAIQNCKSINQRIIGTLYITISLSSHYFHFCQLQDA